MKKLLALIALVLAASAPSPLSAQGLIAPGHVIGNGSAATRTPTDATLTSVFDRAFCATNGQTLVRAAGTWGCGAISPGALSLTNTHVFVGNGSNVAADVAMSGDATISNTGALSIGATKVTSAMLNADVFSTAHTWSALQTAQGLTTTSPGWYVQLTGDTFPRVRVGLNSVDVASLAFGPGNAARDTFIERVGVGALRFGAPDAAAPVAQISSVQNVVAGTSNTAGADRRIAGSQGTGTGAGGKIILQVAPAGGSGTAQNALVDALTLFGTGGLNAGAPTGGDKGAGTVNMTGCFVNNVACLTGNQSITLSGDVTGSGTTAITTVLANIPSAVPMAGSLLATNIAAPGTPASGKTSIYVDSTSKNIASKNDAGTVNHGIQTRTASANNWIRSIADDGSTTISQPAVGDISGFGTGVATALGVNVGSAGAFVTFNGALGTPSSVTLTNATGLPISGITGLGTGIGTWLATPSSANLAAALTDETGSGPAVFGTAPTISGATLSGGPIVSQNWYTRGVISPTALSGDVNDYNPTGLATAAIIRQDGGAADRNITGLTAQSSGTKIALLNIGATNNLILKNASGSSSAANRFCIGADITQTPGQSTALWYDNTSSCWRAESTYTAAGGAAAGTVTTVTPGAGLVSSVTASCSQSAITTTGTLSAAHCVNAQTGTTYTMVDGDRAKLVTGSNAAAQAWTIGQAGTSTFFSAGWYTDIRNLSTNVAGIITITPTTSTINGAATYKIQPGQSVRIVSDGTNYQVWVASNTAQLPATTTNDAANAGNLGEEISSIITSGSPTSLTTNVAANLTSISVTAGDWDITCPIMFAGNSSTVITDYVSASISTTSATPDTSAGNAASVAAKAASLNAGAPGGYSANVGPVRVSLSATTTYYCVAKTTFTVSTLGVYGILRARRMR